MCAVAPAIEIEPGQRWAPIGAPDQWLEIAGPIAGDSWAVISATGDITTIATQLLLDAYQLT